MNTNKARNRKNTFLNGIKLAMTVLCMSTASYGSATVCCEAPRSENIFSLDGVDASRYAGHYNTLPSVEDANLDLQGRYLFPDFLSKAEEVIASYGFEVHTGLRLIHRHFDLSPSNVMVEEFQDYERTPSLVTSALPVQEALVKSAVPSGWIFGETSNSVFEFSTDEAVRSGLKDIQTTPEFLEQMEKAIKDFCLEGLMSVSLLRKDSLPATKGQYYQERTLLTKSVVQISSELDGGARTSWSFGNELNSSNCWAWCDIKIAPHKRWYHAAQPPKK